ncbi:GH3 auxin-responsive promoter family protein [Ancylomarina sp. 16SWW S1-10-2]|uniref:GH3 auxin-responsive promoter family protein n=1 Tax=Ancylomarina sp. 16SWW S1-10-2 TaxID=2499681 RepID=UPI0012AEA53A|nr:GH3 auxin-responsive promoter family protein [Ancylomarina sp. 16SWW S1-10-2]MRT92223.1 GH3 auxin-responsive promoter family protein [Ancylomarina sp. 16SWW S1-10-2]
MALINSIVSWFNTKRLSEIEFMKEHPIDIQHEVLTQLLDKARHTEWGKEHDFQSIDSLDDFKERLPIQTYEDIKPYVDRLRKGEQNIFWPSEIKWFAKSSGTTNSKSKFIPVSKEALEDCHFRGGKDILTLYTSLFPDTGILKGKGLTLGGSHHINNVNNESYYGDLSAILIQNLPFWADFIRTPDTSIVLLDKWEEKLYKITEATMSENVTSLSGVPSWYLVLLKHILKVSGKKNIHEIWPNLELFVHGGVCFDPYRNQFDSILLPEKMNYMETYNASEGFFGIQDDLNDKSMLLMLDYGIYYEFIPLENVDDENPKVLSLENVELHKNYAIIITTNGGLWRYQIGDTVQFTSLKPFKFKISGRTKLFINAFGEEIIIDNAEKAMLQACEKTNAIIKDYMGAPIFMANDKKGTHQWLIEFEKAPANIDEFNYLFDNALMNQNSDYEAKRYKNITLDKPVITIARSGLFYDWLKKKGKLGGQNKVPRLANDRKLIEEVLSMNQI